MASSGRYLSQFKTGTSNGGLTAHPGGDRWHWESRLFDGRYDTTPADARPVYGALDLGEAHGSAPRFGSAFLRLRPEASARATFCYPDSVFQPDRIVGADELPALVELTPDVIGVAARSGLHPAQSLKKVWHLLARYGRGADDRDS